ncbi:hypothetical protein CE11_00124 [Megavirus courdo11]|uniref:Uncharacterized protein n=1 Tax=Megavirus courdo11 TaxID=1128140 RepID=K7Z7D1_9VIRU|nr:hypothetical protein CE11_00124 [Megavirus courdo11]
MKKNIGNKNYLPEFYTRIQHTGLAKKYPVGSNTLNSNSWNLNGIPRTIMSNNLRSKLKKFRLGNNYKATCAESYTIRDSLVKQDKLIDKYQSELTKLKAVHEDLTDKYYSQIGPLVKRNQELASNHNDLTNKYQELFDKHNEMKIKYDNIITKKVDPNLQATSDIVVKHHQLAKNYAQLVQQYKELMARNRNSKSSNMSVDLVNQYNQLSDNYRDLTDNYKNIIVKHFK